ncbi:4-hydroxy-tetrahydrodipicolinate synthase [Candidatus Woesearchaeota archaeon]|nr:4-hydroxy-tetrahydrodipicolinate synthase [Candidatus Woesearchaeota archaeon]
MENEHSDEIGYVDHNIHGAGTALVTPMNSNGSVDYGALKHLVEFQIDKGIGFLVPCGTTGESATLSNRQHDLVVERVVEYADGRVPVVGGTGSNSTCEALKRTRHAKEAGVDAVLLVEPYYNKPEEEDIISEYYTIIATENEDLPMIAYHVPGRTGASFTEYSARELAKIPEFIGVKWADPTDLETARFICENPGLELYSGEDAENLIFYKMGGKGAISVTANAVPDLVSEVWNLYAAGDNEGAESLQERIAELNSAMFIAGNPKSVKTALHAMGMIQPHARKPISLATGNKRTTIETALENIGIQVVNR